MGKLDCLAFIWIDRSIFPLSSCVDNIYINYNQPDQKALEQISVAEAEEYIKEGHFAAGSMLPKIEAALDFVKGDDKRKAIITSIENLENIDKEAGTVISQKG